MAVAEKKLEDFAPETMRAQIDALFGLDILTTYDVVTCRPQTPLSEVFKRMEAQSVRHIPVVDRHKVPVGIISDRDIFQHAKLEDGTITCETHAVAEQIMTTNPVTCEITGDCVEALANMLVWKIDCVLITEKQKLIGIVTSTDLLSAASELLRRFR